MTSFGNHAKSFFITFVTLLLATMLPMLGAMPFTKAGLISLGIAALRSAVKILAELLGVTATV